MKKMYQKGRRRIWFCEQSNTWFGFEKPEDVVYGFKPFIPNQFIDKEDALGWLQEVKYLPPPIEVIRRSIARFHEIFGPSKMGPIVLAPEFNWFRSSGWFYYNHRPNGEHWVAQVDRHGRLMNTVFNSKNVSWEPRDESIRRGRLLWD